MTTIKREKNKNNTDESTGILGTAPKKLAKSILSKLEDI